MANIYARAAGGNWNTNATWSTTSGGAADTVKPTAADDVFLDASSGAITIDAASVGRSLNCTGYTNTLLHNAFTLTLGDSTAGASNIALKLVSGMTYTLADVVNSAISFISTSSTQQTIDCGGKNVGSLTFTGASQEYVFTSTVTTAATATLTYTGGASSRIHFDGASDRLGLSHSIGKFSSNNANVRIMDLGNSSITLSGTGTVWDMGTSTNATLFKNISTIVISDSGASSKTFNGGNKIYYDLFISGGGAGAVIFVDSNTFNRFGITAPKTVTFTIATTQLVDSFVATGDAVNGITIQSSSVGTPATLRDVAGTNILHYCTFKDITAAST